MPLSYQVNRFFGLPKYHRLRNTVGTGLSTSPSIHIVRWRIFTVCDRHDVAGFGLVIELQFNPTCPKLPQHILDSPLDRRIVRAIASHEFLDHGPECRRR